MNNPTIELKAKMYVYDLHNAALENGFKTDEGWECSMANAEEKTLLERRYYPTISAKVLPELLNELFHLVQSKLKQNFEQAHTGRPDGSLQYLIAYNPKRVRP